MENPRVSVRIIVILITMENLIAQQNKNTQRYRVAKKVTGIRFNNVPNPNEVVAISFNLNPQYFCIFHAHQKSQLVDMMRN